MNGGWVQCVCLNNVMVEGKEWQQKGTQLGVCPPFEGNLFCLQGVAYPSSTRARMWGEMLRL